MSDASIPTHCPGTQSENAGKESACAGCPNQGICSSNTLSEPDPDVSVIRDRLSKIKVKILVMSGKGGVGKSTLTALIARAFAAPSNKLKISSEALNVSVLDLDLCGPSMPRAFAIQDEQVHQSGSGWSPIYVRDNLAVMSSGLIMPSKDSALIWRGPKKNALVKQMLKDVDWSTGGDGSNSSGLPDIMLIDTPPGTSDEHMSIVNLLGIKGHDDNGQLDGCILVTTAQEIALMDVRRQMSFCARVSLPILGVVENMAYFTCRNCSHTTRDIFTQSVKQDESSTSTSVVSDTIKMFDNCGPILASLPLDFSIGKSIDEGIDMFDEDEIIDDVDENNTMSDTKLKVFEITKQLREILNF